jgi:hypothetical protein
MGAMKTDSSLDSIFFGGASGFEDCPLGGPSFDDVIPGTGLEIGALRAVVRRQFVGSVIVALLVVMAAVSLTMRPMQDGVQTRNDPTVQQPVFANPDRIAAIKRYDLP